MHDNFIYTIDDSKELILTKDFKVIIKDNGNVIFNKYITFNKEEKALSTLLKNIDSRDIDSVSSNLVAFSNEIDNLFHRENLMRIAKNGDILYYTSNEIHLKKSNDKVLTIRIMNINDNIDESYDILLEKTKSFTKDELQGLLYDVMKFREEDTEVEVTEDNYLKLLNFIPSEEILAFVDKYFNRR